MTRQGLDILHEQYARLAAVAENNIGEPSEDALWDRADHFWERVVLPAKHQLEMESDQQEMDAAYADWRRKLRRLLRDDGMDAAQADLLDLQESLEMDKRI